MVELPTDGSGESDREGAPDIPWRNEVRIVPCPRLTDLPPVASMVKLSLQSQYAFKKVRYVLSLWHNEGESEEQPSRDGNECPCTESLVRNTVHLPIITLDSGGECDQGDSMTY